MRWLPLVFLAACSVLNSSQEPPESAPDQAPAAEPAETTEEPSGPEDEPLRSLPEGRRPDSAVPVALVGFGLRLHLNPPFQAARIGHMLPSGHPETLAVSWWDTTAPEAGQHGDAGLYNITLIPGEPQPEGSPLSTVDQERPVQYRIGDTGTVVRLPKGFDALGGMGRLEPGPTTQSWSVETVSETTDLPIGPLLHSGDPESGTPFYFKEMPDRPWGAWPDP